MEFRQRKSFEMAAKLQSISTAADLLDLGIIPGEENSDDISFMILIYSASQFPATSKKLTPQ